MKNFKSIPIGILLFCITYLVNGQTEKGKILLVCETKLNFTSLNSKWKSDDGNGEDGKTSNLEFSPQLGFFVIDNLALGIELPINYSSEKNENDNKFHSTSVAFAPFIRYYFGTNNIKPYLHSGIGFGYQKMGYDLNASYSDYNMNPSQDFKSTISLYEFGGGLAIFLNEKTSLDIEIGYASGSIKPKKDNNNNYRSITSGIGLGIGFAIII
jgi:outer membrane protein